MPQRKTWNPAEDEALKHLREQLKISKWSFIAKKMTQEYGMVGRTGKQCRERYHNHLDSTILRNQWSSDEQQHLYKLHDEIGNKWAIIAQKLPGRTDNCVKNHFYSKMRKAIRKLNKIIHLHFKREIKEIKLNVLYKLVQATDEKFKISPSIDEQISDRCCELKNQLLTYASLQDQQNEDIVYLEQLARAIHQVSSKYRKKPKRSRRHSAHAPDIISLGKIASKYRPNSQNQQESQDEDESHELREDSLFLGYDENLNNLESVKQEEQPRNGWKVPQTVSTFIQQSDQKMKINENDQLIQREENLQKIGQQEYLSIDQEISHLNPAKHYQIQEQLPEKDFVEDMLSEEIEKMKIRGDFHYDEIQIDDKDQIFEDVNFISSS